MYCINNDIENNPHKNHCRIYILDYMLSNHDINNLNDKIKKKLDFIEEVLISIEKWQKIFIKKIERLKESVKNEKQIIEKLFSNFNPFFINYLKNFMNLLNLNNLQKI